MKSLEAATSYDPAVKLAAVLSSLGADQPGIETPIATMKQAMDRTKLSGREVPGAEDPAMRFQLGDKVSADVHTLLPADPDGIRRLHTEKNASFFKLRAWGSSWAGAVAFLHRNSK